MVTTVTVFIPDDQEIEAIRLRPMAAKLATVQPPGESNLPAGGGTSINTTIATFVSPSSSDLQTDYSTD